MNVDSCRACPVTQVEKSALTSLAERLGKQSLEELDKLTIKADEALSQDAHPAALRASLSLLKALSCAPTELCFSGWSATSDVIREFKALSDVPVLAQAPAGTLKLDIQLQTGDRGRRRVDGWPITELPQLLPK